MEAMGNFQRKEKKQQPKSNGEEIHKALFVELHDLTEKLSRRNKQIKALREENARLRNATNK